MLLQAITFIRSINHILIAVLIFAIIAVSEQIINGIFSTKFIIKDLIDIFTWIFSQLSVKYGLDSWLNTPREQMVK